MRFGLLACVLLSCLPWTAQAGVRWSIGLNFGAPCYRPCYGPVVIARPYPYYIAPAPVIVP